MLEKADAAVNSIVLLSRKILATIIADFSMGCRNFVFNRNPTSISK